MLRVLQDKLGKIIAEADDETRTTLFAVTEAFATKTQARKIAEHPLRGKRVGIRVTTHQRRPAEHKD